MNKEEKNWGGSVNPFPESISMLLMSTAKDDDVQRSGNFYKKEKKTSLFRIDLSRLNQHRTENLHL